VIKKMVRRNWQDKKCFVVVGGGPSGAICVETLRQEGFTGRLILICREKHLPYDRVEIMNSLNKGTNHFCLRDEKFYKDYDIEVCLKLKS